MSTSTPEILLCLYHYDPLDRQVDCTPFEQVAVQRHYCKTRLASEIQGPVQRSVLQYDDQLLAQLQRKEGKLVATLVVTDQQRSVLNARDSGKSHPFSSAAYTPYGHRVRENGSLSLFGFNGERPDAVTEHYHLGNGYRQYNPALMRFNSPDSWSPFGVGGLNAYMYCRADPINRSDSTGHFSVGLFLHAFGIGATLVGAVTSAVGIVTKNRVVEYAGFVVAATGIMLSIGGRINMRSSSRAILRSRNQPPPDYEDSLGMVNPNRRFSNVSSSSVASQNYVPPPTYDEAMANSISRPASRFTNSTAGRSAALDASTDGLEMRQLRRSITSTESHSNQSGSYLTAQSSPRGSVGSLSGQGSRIRK